MENQEITLMLAGEDYPAFEESIIREHPVPLIDDLAFEPDDENAAIPQIPKYTNLEWIAFLALGYLGREAIEGAKKLKLEKDPVDVAMLQRAQELNKL